MKEFYLCDINLQMITYIHKYIYILIFISNL